MDPTASHELSDLDKFIGFLYDGLEGYAYLAAKTPDASDEEWLRQFFKVPEEYGKLADTITKASPTLETYLSPVVYSERRSTKEFVKETNVVWTEFDGNAPEEWPENFQPSVIIQSSANDHQHIYWKLNVPLQGPDLIESITRKITYHFEADASAWDATQVLRPPTTNNHKREQPVVLRSMESVKYDADIFTQLGDAPEEPDVAQWEIGSLPDIQEVVLNYAFPPEVVKLLQNKHMEVGKRSSALMNVAYSLAENTPMSDVEIFVVLKMADDIWGKFKKRRDRSKRLAHIVAVARRKYPYQDIVQLGSAVGLAPEPTPENSNQTLVLNYVDFISIEVEFDWVVENMLMDQGNMLLAGESGVGKTQITLEFLKHIALGKDFLHYKIPNAQKLLFLSLEMGLPDLQMFMRKQDKVLDSSERDLLRENLIIVPHGEAWPLNTKSGQDSLDRLLDALQPSGLFVDSIGSAILGDINSQKTVQEFTNYNDHIRKQRNLFLWYVHHTRKRQPGQKTSDQHDVYGDQYLVNRATSSYGVLRAKNGHIRIRNFKNRLAARERDYYIERDAETLTFKGVSAELVQTLHANEILPGGEDDNPTAGNGMPI